MLIRSVLATAVLFVSSHRVVAEEPNPPATDIPTLRTHKIRAAEAHDVLVVVKPLLSDTRIALSPTSREIIVFAKPAIQQSIADAIAKHEKTGLLFQQLDLRGADPKLVEQVVSSGLRAAATDKKRAESKRFRLEFGRFARDVRVWGRAAEIEFVQDAITVLGKQQASDLPRPAQARREPSEPTAEEFSSKPILDGGPVLAPDGPIRLVPIKGADLLLIRGKRTDVERVFGK